MEYVTIQDTQVPALGFGTARMDKPTSQKAVKSALDLGYRHIDTAQMYENEDAVGRAIRQADVDRDEIFLVTKIHRENLAYSDVHDSFNASLNRLDMESVDLLLIHAPSRTVPLSESIDAMNELQAENRVDHIGVSNFSIDQLETALSASDTPIFTNQVEYHPFNRQDEVLDFCIDQNIMLTAYSPLNVGKGLDHQTLRDIGEQYGKSPAQVVLRWLIQQPTVSAIPKAEHPEHQQENIDIFDFTLGEDDMDRIFNIDGELLTSLRSKLR